MSFIRDKHVQKNPAYINTCTIHWVIIFYMSLINYFQWCALPIVVIPSEKR